MELIQPLFPSETSEARPPAFAFPLTHLYYKFPHNKHLSYEHSIASAVPSFQSLQGCSQTQHSHVCHSSSPQPGTNFCPILFQLL